MWTKKYSIIYAFLLLFAACSTTKTVSTTAGAAKELSKKDKRSLVESVSANLVDYETFSTKAKTRLSVDNKSFNSNLNIRIKKGETIWISATAFLGIEAARIKITPDRIQIMNRLQSTYIDKPFEYIYNYTTSELTFQELEDLFVGNSMGFYDNEVNQVLALGENYLVLGELESLDFEMKYAENYTLQQTKLREDGRGQSMQVDYDNYKEVDSFNIPNAVRIGLKAEKIDVNAEMDYEEIRFNQNLNFPFSVPERYKKL